MTKRFLPALVGLLLLWPGLAFGQASKLIGTWSSHIDDAQGTYVVLFATFAPNGAYSLQMNVAARPNLMAVSVTYQGSWTMSSDTQLTTTPTSCDSPAGCLGLNVSTTASISFPGPSQMTSMDGGVPLNWVRH